MCKISGIKEDTGHDAKGKEGMDYQFLYFINRLLKMVEKGDVVSYERYDDVSMLSGEVLVYFQLKHTIGGSPQKPVNLRLRDHDLWKTIAVWIDITKKQDEDKQIDFLENNRFVLVTNKKSESNPFWIELQKYKKNKISFDEMKNFYMKVYNETKDTKPDKEKTKKENQTKSYIKCLLDFNYANQLLKSMSICFEPDLRSEILDSLEHNKNIPQKNVEEAYQELLSLVIDNINLHKKSSYTRNEFSKAFDRISQKYRGRKFSFLKNTITEFPSHLEEQIFIKQLIDVEDITYDDVDDIVEYTKEKFDYINNVSTAIRNEEVSTKEVEDTRVEAIRFWRQQYKYYFKRVNKDDNGKIIEKAEDLLNVIRKQEIYFVEGKLETYFSNGCFYYLSDKDNDHEPQIGWRPGWKEKYQNNG